MDAFGISQSQHPSISTSLCATKKSAKSGSGFGGGFGASSSKKKPARSKSGRGDLISALNESDSKKEPKPSRTFVKSDQEKCKLYLSASMY